MDKLNIRKLDQEADLSQFDCGNGSINSLIRDGYFTTLIKQGYAYEIRLNEKIIGYYLIKIMSLAYEDYETTTGKDKYAAIYLNYLAIDQKYQKKEYGTTILKYIVKYAKQISQQLPVRFLVIDALRERARWYYQKGFSFFDEEDLSGEASTIAMYMDFVDREVVEAYFS